MEKLTSFEIEETLLVEAKKQVLDEGTSLKELLNRLLKEYLLTKRSNRK